MKSIRISANAIERGARIVILLVGLTIAHLGVTLFLLADMGADPFNVLVQGIFHTLSRGTGWSFLTHGNTHIVINLLIVAILLVVDKSYIRIGTVLCMLCGGPIIDFFTGCIAPVFPTDGSIYIKLAILGAGCVILALGMSLVIKSEAGVGPNDLVALAISEKLRLPFGPVRIVTDGAFVLAGWLLGGAVGIGTIVCAALVGPVAGFFLPKSERIVQGILGKIPASYRARG